MRTADAQVGRDVRTAADRRAAPYFLKVLSADADWIMRVTGNTTHWEWQVWRAGLYDAVPAEIDHAMVAMALDRTGPAPRLAMLMTDCADDLVPAGRRCSCRRTSTPAFIEHLAAMHAAKLGWTDTIGLQQLERRFLFFAPAIIAAELDVDGRARARSGSPTRAGRLLPRRSPRPRRRRPGGARRPRRARRCAPRQTPQTFVAGDWKLGNLGSRPDGRTIVLDWAYPGEAPPCWELAWYLALNRSRLPETKEATIERYRRALEARGVETGDWWDRQLGLCLLGMMATIAWEKAVGDEDELAWWTAAAVAGAAVARVSSDPVRGAYRGGAGSWAVDASLAYVPLARHLVAPARRRAAGAPRPGRRCGDGRRR